MTTYLTSCERHQSTWLRAGPFETAPSGPKRAPPPDPKDRAATLWSGCDTRTVRPEITLAALRWAFVCYSAAQSSRLSVLGRWL
ncbi:hypothetical protein GCM10010103_79020 [Streptomyces paradoxus]